MDQDNNIQNQNVPTTNTPVPPRQDSNPPVVGGNPPQIPGVADNKKKPLVAVIVAVITVLLLAGSAAAWILMRGDNNTPKDSPQKNNTADTSQTTSSFDTPEDTVAAVSAKIKDLIGAQGAFTYSADTSASDPNVYVSKDDYAVAVKTTPSLYAALQLAANPAANSAEAQDAATKKAEDLSAQLKEYLKTTGGFTVTTVKQTAPTGDYTDKILFSKNGLTCDASLFITYDPFFSVGCIKQTDADVALAEYTPFIAEYLKHGQKATTYSLTYKDGKNDYKIANLNADTQQHAFLQKSGASSWSYFSKISSQDMENCSLYESNADAQLAFAGTSCYRNNASSTVGSQ